MYIIYTEIRHDGSVQRWYYGTYADRDRANEIALEMNEHSESNIRRCVCEESKAESFGIMNMPKGVE